MSTRRLATALAGIEGRPSAFAKAAADKKGPPLQGPPGRVAKHTDQVRDLTKEDFIAVCRIDARLTGTRKTAYWREVFDRFLNAAEPRFHISLAAERGGRVVGFLLGEVRAVEFGSEECGWIFAVGVDPAEAQRGVGSSLVTEACVRFRAAGVMTVRTMVRRNDVPMLSFFRSNAFVGGAYVQLETHVSQE